MEQHFKKKWSQIVKNEPLVFTDFISKQGTYEEVTDHAELVRVKLIISSV
jgi:hypothetical protein